MADFDVMPDYDKLPSISILDTAALPDFDDEAPTATNLTSKKKKKKKIKTPTPSSSNTSKSKSKKKKKTQPRKASAIRDRVRKYDELTRKADAESKEIQNPGKKGNDKIGKKKNNKKKNKDKDKDKDDKKEEKESLSPEPSITDAAENNVDAPSLLIQASTDSQKMLNASRMLESISPMNASMMDTSNIFQLDDDNKDNDIPPPAYQLNLPSSPDEINVDRSFEAMYEPAYRHTIVPHPKHDDMEPPKLLKGRDGDTDRELIKERIAEKEQFKAKLKRKQSRTTAFDAKKQNSNLWGRKMNEFVTKNGKQKIIEWRFLTPTDNAAHTLVLQHEQIKKKKKSKRMLILDGVEKYSDKSKKIEWKLSVPNCSDQLIVNIENVDINTMKYNYRLKINELAYSVVFHKWKSSQ